MSDSTAHAAESAVDRATQDETQDDVSATAPKLAAENPAVVEQKATSRRVPKRKAKSVSFPEQPNLVTGFIEPESPWKHFHRLTPCELVAAYKAACDELCTDPLYSIVTQLEAINLKENIQRHSELCLKGIQLNQLQVESLEEVFKRVPFVFLNLENTNLDDFLLASLCDMLDFYEPCTELCIARNPNITLTGLKCLCRTLKRLTGLTWLDLHGLPLTEAGSLVLAFGIRVQALRCRKARSLIRSQRMEVKEKLLSEQGNVAPSTISSDDTNVSSDVPIEDIAMVLESPPTGLRGLHLGLTDLHGKALSHIMVAVRLAGQITDLRLPDNALGPNDIEQMIHLLRYCGNLRHLDLSRNKLGDEGCAILASALATPCFSSSCSKDAESGVSGSSNEKNGGGLFRLLLSDNHLGVAAMQALSPALCQMHRLKCLRLSENPGIGCNGLAALRHGLITCRSLVRLGLMNCGLKCVGAVAVAEVLADAPRQLSLVELHHNEIGVAGLIALAQALKHADNPTQLIGLETNTPNHSIGQSDVDISKVATAPGTSGSVVKAVATLASPSIGNNDKTPETTVQDEVSPELRATYLSMITESGLKAYAKKHRLHAPSFGVAMAQGDTLSEVNRSSRIRAYSSPSAVPMREDHDPRHMWGDEIFEQIDEMEKSTSEKDEIDTVENEAELEEGDEDSLFADTILTACRKYLDAPLPLDDVLRKQLRVRKTGVYKPPIVEVHEGIKCPEVETSINDGTNLNKPEEDDFPARFTSTMSPTDKMFIDSLLTLPEVPTEQDDKTTEGNSKLIPSTVTPNDEGTA